MATLANIVRCYTSTTGTGTMTLTGAVPGFLTPAQAGLVNGVTVSYCIMDGAQTEVGRGVYNSAAQTITRGVLRSTNGNALINMAATAEIAITFLNEDKTDLETLINGKLSAPVANASLASITGTTVKGNYTGTATPQDLTMDQLRVMLSIAKAAGADWNRVVLSNCIILGATTTVNLTGGDGQIFFPVAFPNQPVHVVCGNGDGDVGPNLIFNQRADQLGSSAGFVLRAWNPNAGAGHNGVVRVTYMAMGLLT